MPKLIELTGRRFGRWLVVKRVPGPIANRVYYECKCECGNSKVVKSDQLTMGKSKSCGCWHSEVCRKVCGDNFRTHGKTHSLTWNSWSSMIQRCCQPTHVSYPTYRAFTPCGFLRESVDNLIAVIGIRVSRYLTLDRINTLSGYHCGQCPECIANNWILNVRWATLKEQAANRKSAKHLGLVVLWQGCRVRLSGNPF